MDGEPKRMTLNPGKSAISDPPVPKFEDNKPIEFRLSAHPSLPGLWEVVAIKQKGRTAYKVQFFGENSEQMAKEYLAWKRGQLNG